MASIKTTHIQLRVSIEEKAIIQASAERAGMDMSAWILAQVVTGPKKRWADLVKSLNQSRQAEHKRYIFANINDFLSGLDTSHIAEVLSAPDHIHLDEFDANYLAAMVEVVCHSRDLRAPPWTMQIPPLSHPHFGTNLHSLRLYLLRSALAPFRSRNIFVDSSIGDRI